MSQVMITKLDHTGQPVLSYAGELVYRDEELVVARCIWTHETFDLGNFPLERGDIFMEFYYFREGFNIFQVYSAPGRLKGWYCNITAPVEVLAHEIRWLDLALDLLVLPNGQQVIRDVEEFEALQPSPELRAYVATALQKLQNWAEQRRAPFNWGRLSRPINEHPSL